MADDLEVDDLELDPVEETDDSTEEEVVEEDENIDEEESDDEDDEEELEVEEDKPPSEYHKSVYKKIKGKYPEIFKDFPELKEVYFRENEFSTLFPTIEDAKVAANKVANFDVLAEDLTGGSAKILLRELAGVSKDTLGKVAKDFLPQLMEVDQNAYYAVVEPVLQTFIKNLYNAGKSKGNESVQAAALYALEFGWGHTDIDAVLKDKPVDPQLDEEKKKLQGKEAELEKQNYETAFNGINRYVTKIISKDIAKLTEKIDDDYKKEKALSDIFAEVNRVLTDDPRHMRLMESLWARSRASKYDEKSRRQIISTLLARAKQVMPEAARTIMAKANKTKKKTTTTNNDAGGKVTNSSSPQGNVGKVDMSKYKDGADFLRAYSENKGKVARIT